MGYECALCGGGDGVRDMFIDHYAYDRTIVSPICDSCRPGDYDGKFLIIENNDDS